VDEITVTVPRERPFGAVAGLVLGGVAARHELTLDVLDDLQGYTGLVRANAAWLAYRDGDHDAAVALAESALDDWYSEGRSGPTVFQWAARFPLVGVNLARDRAEFAFAHARSMLDPSQQTLPPELHALVTRAVEERDASTLQRAVDHARTSGHA